MALAAGTRLGPYEIMAPLGAGGMGEVYRARDTRLDRTVALKVLPASLAADPQFRQRFDREARAISSLDHPHICVLHDVGHADGIDFLVMQYLEGETLAARLARGPLPLAEALRHGIEIAGALDKAHRAGIFHRDLKPGNVMLTKAGARLLDFGLAKLTAVETVPPAHTVAPTATSPLTGQGTILGTLQYMAPEQLEGRETDARSDLFSFGTILYEMVTGATAFGGASQASLIAAILEHEPAPMSARAPLTPPALERVVRKCLAKDPDARWQSARDLGDELAWIAQGSGVLSNVPAVPLRKAWRRHAVPLLLLTVLVAIAAAGRSWMGSREPAGAGGPRYLDIGMPPDVQLEAGGIAVSPDGGTIVFSAAPLQRPPDGGTPVALARRLYVRHLDAPGATPLAGTEGAFAPFFSPDGRSVAYFTDSALFRVSLLGGNPERLASMPPVTQGGAWGADDLIVFSPTQHSQLHQVPARGGAASPLNPSAPADQAELWPAFLPDGRHVLFTIRRDTALHRDEVDVAVQNVRTGERRLLVRGGGYARYAPSGHLLFVRGGTLLAVPFDPARLDVTGDPLPIAEGVAVDRWLGGAHVAVSKATLLYMTGRFDEARRRAVFVDREGQPAAGPGMVESALAAPRISPSGESIVFNATTPEGDSEIFVADARRGRLVRLSTDPADNFNPIWSHDGRHVIYSSFGTGQLPKLMWRPADGSGTSEPLVPGDGVQFAGSVSPSGILAYSLAVTDGRGTNIWTIPLTGPDRVARPLVESLHADYGPEFSPDGRWIAYVSTESGAQEVYVIPFPGPGGKRRISSEGGMSPAWSRDGTELYYQSSDRMMVVAVSGGPDPFGEPRVLFRGTFVTGGREDDPRAYDVHDGRFLMIQRQAAQGAAPSFHVVLDWVAALSRGRP
jgi:eukaryotic-like serine/threonine-protein kinase